MILAISVARLTLGTEGPDVARVHQALQALGLSVSAADLSERVMGAGTVAVIRALQAELDLSQTGVVDAATVRSINVRLANLATDQRVVRGQVRDANGAPLARGVVQIFGQAVSGEQVLGKSELSATDGSYAIRYQPPANSKGHVDLRVALLSSAGAPIETIPPGTSILTNAGPLEVVDFVLSAAANPPLSEFELISADLAPLLGGRTMVELTGREISLLASQSGYSSDQVAALVVAHKLARTTKTPIPVFYGMLRQGQPANAFALHSVDQDVLLKALQAAVDQGIVPKLVDGKPIESYLADFAPAPDAQLQKLLGGILNPNEIKSFLGQYLKSSQDIDAFWRGVAADPALASRAARLENTVRFAVLFNNLLSLLTAVQAMPGIKQASDLAGITEEKWKSLIQTPGIGFPVETPGADANEQTHNYIKQIVGQIEAAFPTRFLAERLDASPVATFLKGNPGFDLYKHRLEDNPAAAQSLTPQGKNQLRALQGVYRLTGSAEDAIGIVKNGFGSAAQIAQMDLKIFAERNQGILSAERAQEVYAQAQRTTATAMALLSEHGADLNRTALHVLPRLDAQKQKDAAQADAAGRGIPDWETLFGGFDLCACEECSSAHSPAAYFVDLLHFLDLRGVKDALFARRPDLGDIELSCENTNTVLPLIDLANEILEHAVAPPLAFVPITLAPALEAALNQRVAPAELAAVFSPPLQAGTLIEILEDGKRWRIWDELFAYNVVKANNVLTVDARSRNTRGSTEERRAIPQYRNAAAYTELGQAVFPWALPFDQPAEEAHALFTQIGVPRRDLIQALRPQPDVFDPNLPVTLRLAAERLGLTDTERKIIVGEPLNPTHQPEDFWGSVPFTALNPVQELLDRSGLTYAELESLIATWFINPAKTVSIAAKPLEPVDTCDTTKLQINGLTAEIASRLHRFARLWRKLGWKIEETDKAIRAFNPNPTTLLPVLTNEILVRLDHLRALAAQLRLSVAQTLALWKPIDTSEPGSLYHSLFYNPALFKPQDESFQLRPNGLELVHETDLLTAHVAPLQAVFRLSPAGFTLLVALTNGKFKLANLSLLYRHATLAQRLGLSVQDLRTAIELTGIDPFRADRTQDTLRFVEVVRAIHSSGFELAELDYLLRDRFNPAAAFVPAEALLAQALTEVRASLLTLDDPANTLAATLQVRDRVATALALPVDVTATLLGRVSHASKTALQSFLELPAIDAQLLSRDNARVQFETLAKLLKTAAIIQALKLPASQLDWLFASTSNPQLPITADFRTSWLAADSPATPAFASWFPLIQLQQLRQALALEESGLEAILSALTAVVVAVGGPAQIAAKAALVETLTRRLAWPQADLEALIGKAAASGLLSVRLPGDYRGLALILRLHGALSLLKKLGVTAVQASAWCEAAITPENAKAIRSAVKATYDDDAWLKVATSLQDTLRDAQRAALVAYLVARPDRWRPGLARADANDLYGHFLIDVEMSSCQLTSRIKQALASVQLFGQRCLMGLEPDIQTSDGKWAQWEWMKNFRVWEVNRKIWLYPENWIEPELRDDKTPFFKDLENELLQTDLDDAAAEQALLHYLEKLDAVANLEIVGVYEDDQDKTLHVFGRTQHIPHVYYYRYRDGATQVWAPWEQLTLDIEGDHLIPVIWNRRLMLIWPIFAEKAQQTDVEMPQPGNKLKSADRYWEIQLAWSEYQYGRWSGKKLSEPVKFKAYQGQNAISFDTPVVAPENAPIVFLRPVGPGERPEEDQTGGDGDETGGTGSGSPGSSSTSARKEPVSKNKITFKAIATATTLKVVGYLRRDYRSGPIAGDAQIACVFGEFQFSGCREIVTTANHAQVAQRNFALAPTGTKFDGMWFTQTATGLLLFDGKFPVLVRNPRVGDINQSPSIVGDPAPTLVAKQDIPVLGQSPSPFRLLAAHQDLQFVCNRPSFYMDGQRTFMVTSTGESGQRFRQQRADWVNGNLATAWRADYFPPAPALPDGAGSVAEPAPLTVLVPGPGGVRVARRAVAVNLQPEFSPPTLVPVFWTTREYTFVNFYHPYLCAFERAFHQRGIAGLLSRDTQSLHNDQSFDAYAPSVRVLSTHPVDEVEFQAGGAYERYNWELFFHIPLLIANQLNANQRFKEAQRWFHFIFDPTGASGGDAPQRYWQTKPFYDRMADGYAAESVKRIEEMLANGLSDELKAAVAAWRENPFSPHRVARFRLTAYQKTVVMKYIDNLIDWGDQLFRRETLESLNEATQLYVLAAEILGRRPEVIRRNLKPVVQTFNSLAPELGALGNALEQIELLVSDAGGASAAGDSVPTPDPPSNTMLYFCVPENDQLLGYWSTVADRLFKIRHCMNIEGLVRQLPVFEPPLDPALLVRAGAAGLSIADIVNDISVPLPNYRFAVMLQKANELVAEIRNLGASLLSILEKRDAEALSLLRSGQELRLLQAVRDVRVKQIDEAHINIEGLQKSRDMAQARKEYYESRETISLLEGTSLLLTTLSMIPLKVKATAEQLAQVSHLFPTFKLGSPTTTGPESGPPNQAKSSEALGKQQETIATILNISSMLTNRMAEYSRRQDEWDHQANLATRELRQIDQQLLAAQIRLAIAEQELRNHDRQIDNAGDVDQFQRNKFTNQDLYHYMVGQVSGLYFQSYQLAYDLAKRAERCFRFELGVQSSNYIGFGYWDSLRKGLLAGEKLQYDLRRLETAYLDQNRREFELTKHISLVLLNPLALVQLRETGRCLISLPEEIFALDFPAHYFRRIKSVSLTLPCIVGPYTTISCTLRLQNSSIRINTTNGTNGYPRNTDAQGLPADDDRFIENSIPVNAIATSHGQNDSGVFELSFRDERYLPFEGAGAVSQWSLELFNDVGADFGKPLRQFDYSTISDAILHIKYTAREDIGPFKDGAVAHLRDYFSQDRATPSLRMLDLRQELPTQWHRFLHPTNPADGNVFALEMTPGLFLFRDEGKTLKINTISLLARCINAGSYDVIVTTPAGSSTMALARSDEYGGLHFGHKKDVGVTIKLTPPLVTWQLQMTRPGGGNLTEGPLPGIMEVEDVILVLGYEWA